MSAAVVRRAPSRMTQEIAMEQDPGDVEWLSLGGNVVRDVAPGCLLAPGEPKSELVLVASSVHSVDVVAGTAARLRIARHFRQRPDGHVTIMPPSSVDVAEHFVELLMPVPDRVTVSTPPALAEPPRYALLPATVITDDTAAVAAGAFALEACDRARISMVRANLVAWAVIELSANALAHAQASDDPPVVAMTVSGRERILEVAVSDLGRGISEARDASSLLGGVPGVKGGEGALAEFLRRGVKRDIDVRLEAFAGTGRLRWTPMRHRASTGVWVPGTTVVARVAT
jgi:hypothetical protein